MQTLRGQGTCVHRVGLTAKCAFTARRNVITVRPTFRDLRVRAEEEPMTGEIEVCPYCFDISVWAIITFNFHYYFPITFAHCSTSYTVFSYRIPNQRLPAKKPRLIVFVLLKNSWSSGQARPSAKAVATHMSLKMEILNTLSHLVCLSKSFLKIGNAPSAVQRRDCSNRNKWKSPDLPKIKGMVLGQTE